MLLPVRKVLSSQVDSFEYCGIIFFKLFEYYFIIMADLVNALNAYLFRLVEPKYNNKWVQAHLMEI